MNNIILTKKNISKNISKIVRHGLHLIHILIRHCVLSIAVKIDLKKKFISSRNKKKS